MIYPFIYEVIVWDDIDHKIESCSGVTFAETYTKAMAKIEDYYGQELVEVRHFEALESGELVEFPSEVRKALADGKFFGEPVEDNK